MLCNRTLQQNVKKQRRVLLGAIHEHLQKYIARLPAFVVSTKLTCHIPGLTASVLYSFIANRCSHLSSQPESVWLADIVIKVVTTHPQQALWTLFAVVKSSSTERATEGFHV
jgi:serine/threonine-protein kinase ATR